VSDRTDPIPEGTAMLMKAAFPTNHLYPTSDGKPMAETDRHRQIMFDLIEVLQAHFAGDPNTYVSGNLLMYYDPKNKRKHLSPDCFVVFGVPDHERINYLTWEEGKCPDVVFEITSSSTQADDTRKKFEKYRDVLKVREYFLFDPFEDYLAPSMQGYRLRAGQYVTIRPHADRLPSQLLGLHLERDGNELRLWNPDTGRWLRTAREQVTEERQRADTERQRADAEKGRADAERQRADAAEAELARLRSRLQPRANGNHN
jgi:Uma2 family endonuclease